MLGQRYLSSTDERHKPALIEFQRKMGKYYRNGQYHSEFIKGINAGWSDGAHVAQLQMCERIPAGASILEVGCGDGSCAAEIDQRTVNTSYVGVDLNPTLWKDNSGFTFISASATQLPFGDASFDVVLSMYVIEHLVFPVQFLDAAWRILKPQGRFLLIAPDFARAGMPSERIGFSYGSGRDKLKQGKWLDALISGYDSKIRLQILRLFRRRTIKRGVCRFPVFTDPRCLKLPGFTPDCDAVYPVCPEEVISYLRNKPGFVRSELFYRQGGTCGLLIQKS